MQPRNRQVSLVAVVALGFVVAFAGPASAQGNSVLGTWKIDLAKSHYDPGPAPKSDERVYEAWEGVGVKTTFTLVNAEGIRIQTGYAAHYDGKDYKYTGAKGRDMVSLRRIDTNTTEAVVKFGGKAVQTTRTVVSDGGKTLTMTSGAGIGRDGKKSNGNVTVYNKQ